MGVYFHSIAITLYIFVSLDVCSGFLVLTFILMLM